MSYFLKQRNIHLHEQMDDPKCDKQDLFNTYDQFSHLNDLISRWKSLFDAYIAPLSEKNRSLYILDVGCGGGDLCCKFSEWASKKGLNVDITGIDPDPRALEYATASDVPANVNFRQATLDELAENRERYDIIVSNHLLHHLAEEELLHLCRHAEKMTRKLVLFNDIHRSSFGFFGFGLIAPLLYRSSFTVQDGLISIRRSYRSAELRKIAPAGWQVKKLIPFRLLMLYETKQ